MPEEVPLCVAGPSGPWGWSLVAVGEMEREYCDTPFLLFLLKFCCAQVWQASTSDPGVPAAHFCGAQTDASAPGGIVQMRARFGVVAVTGSDTNGLWWTENRKAGQLALCAGKPVSASPTTRRSAPRELHYPGPRRGLLAAVSLSLMFSSALRFPCVVSNGSGPLTSCGPN